MEFINQNFINTTTQIAVNSNTTLVANIFNRDQVLQYISSGFADDNTTATATISFGSTLTVDRIGLLAHNLKGFTIFFNGVTANAFAMSTTSDTSTTDYSSNSESSQYFTVTPQACTSVSIDMKSTQDANIDKALGLFLVTDKNLVFERVASAKNYKPNLDPKNIVHKLSDGGTRVHVVQDMWKFQVKYKFITTAFRDSLRTVYSRHTPFIFVPFGTTSSWDGIAQEVVWTGAFKFYQFSDNAATAGFSGSIDLKETPI